MIILLYVIIFSIVGTLLGILTGLIPGFHTNTLALILLSLTSAISALLFFTPDSFLLVAILIVSATISHTFHDFIPTTFLGAPEIDTAISVLPAHKMFLEGRGFEAVFLSAVGSYFAIIFGLLILFPVVIVIGEPLNFYDAIKKIMLFILIFISFVMIVSEKGKITFRGKDSAFLGKMGALFIFLISGMLGIIILDIETTSLLGFSASSLFPALSGLFGAACLVYSLSTKPEIVPQKIKIPKIDGKSCLKSGGVGTFSGLSVSILPGVSSGVAMVMAMNLSSIFSSGKGEEKEKNEEFILTFGAVNTANAFFCLILLFVIMKARSGSSMVLLDLISVEEWEIFSIPHIVPLLLISILVSATLSFFLTISLGKFFAKRIGGIDYENLILYVLVFIVSSVFIFCGILGLLILVVATLIGLIAPIYGLRRTQAMGVLLVPVILSLV